MRAGDTFWKRLRAVGDMFRGMAEAELYAELIIEAHWTKTAGFAMEKSLLEAGQ